MAMVSLGSGKLFSKESYEEYVNIKRRLHNERIRGENETIFDALMSEEARIENNENGAEIIEAIRNFR